MNALKKIAVFFLLFLIIVIFASFYGMIHDQLSYTISSEYFSCFKFNQFGIAENLQNRLGAAIVGLRATWWMGLVIGVFLIPLGLIIPGWKAYLYSMIRVFFIVCLTALSVGIIGLLIGLFTIRSNNLPDFYIPVTVTNPVRFAQAGYMHNFSYLGGLMGILTGAIFIIIERKRVKAKLRSSRELP